MLVGGSGTRLRPLTYTTPKQMLAIVDRPMLEHVVGHLRCHGVTEAVLSLGYRADVFEAAYPNGLCAGVRLRYAVEPAPLDTAGAVRFAAQAAGINETFIVVNGDVITELDVGLVWNRHREIGAEATLALTKVSDPSAYGVVPTDVNGRVEGFVEKPDRATAPTNWVNAGTYVLEPDILSRIPADRPASIERDTFPSVALNGNLWAVRSDAYWIDVGTPAAYLKVHLDLLDDARGLDINAVATDSVVDPTALVQRSIVMSGARIGAQAVVRESVISSGAVVGDDATVDGSIAGPGAVVGRGATATGLCVLGKGATLAENRTFHAVKVP